MCVSKLCGDKLCVSRRRAAGGGGGRRQKCTTKNKNPRQRCGELCENSAKPGQSRSKHHKPLACWNDQNKYRERT